MAESAIPKDAEEVLRSTDLLGCRTFDCVMDGEIVGYRVRDNAGRLLMEGGLKNGLRHGVERHWEPEGDLTFETRWVEGRQVSRRQYRVAADADPTLPPIREEEDRPERDLPVEYVKPER